MQKSKLFSLILPFFLMACSPVKTTVTNQYKLDSFSTKQVSRQSSHLSILISQPEAVAGYQSEEMLYMEKPFEIGTFTKNAWIDPPGDMLFPLIFQSMQRSGYFYAVLSSPAAEQTDYRLDTQLIELQQNFIKKPSVLEFVAKVVLTHVSDNHVMASRIISYHIPCPSDTPYGGVLAANQATQKFTADVTAFTINHVKRNVHK